MKNIDPKLKEAVNVLKFLDHRVRSELKNREKSANSAERVETPQSSGEAPQSQDL